MSTEANRNHEADWRYAEQAMIWYGWGSPVGVGVMLVCLGVAAALLRVAVLGL